MTNWPERVPAGFLGPYGTGSAGRPLQGFPPPDRQWYCSVLVQYFDHAVQFMPCPPQQAYAELFRFLCRTDLLTTSDVSTLLRMAGALALPAELISEMMEVRTRRFETVTGFEDLELD